MTERPTPGPSLPTAIPEGELPERPEDAMAALGIETDDDQGALVALEALRGRIRADLEQTQGPFRQAGVAGRYWPFALALLLGGLAMLLFKPAVNARWDQVLAAVLAGGAGLFCLAAAAVSPTRPGLGERLSRGGLLVAVGALVFELIEAVRMPGDTVDLGAPCAITLVVSGLLPMGALYFGMRRSGLPVRRAHAAAIVAAALALAGATVWLHCPVQNLWHLVVGHVAIPLVVAVGLSFGLFSLFAPRRGVV